MNVFLLGSVEDRISSLIDALGFRQTEELYADGQPIYKHPENECYQIIVLNEFRSEDFQSQKKSVHDALKTACEREFAQQPHILWFVLNNPKRIEEYVLEIIKDAVQKSIHVMIVITGAYELEDTETPFEFKVRLLCMQHKIDMKMVTTYSLLAEKQPYGDGTKHVDPFGIDLLDQSTREIAAKAHKYCEHRARLYAAQSCRQDAESHADDIGKTIAELNEARDFNRLVEEAKKLTYDGIIAIGKKFCAQTVPDLAEDEQDELFREVESNYSSLEPDNAPIPDRPEKTKFVPQWGENSVKLCYAVADGMCRYVTQCAQTRKHPTKENIRHGITKALEYVSKHYVIVFAKNRSWTQTETLRDIVHNAQPPAPGDPELRIEFDPKKFDKQQTFSIMRYVDRTKECMFREQIKRLKELSHPCILPVLEFSDNTNIHNEYIRFTDYMSGSLRDALATKPSWLNNDTTKAILAFGIANGMEYIHAHTTRLFMSGLSPDNILLDDRNQPKLCPISFRCSCQTLAYQAPEIYDGQEYTEKSDVYSFGIILYELLTGNLAFRGVTEAHLVKLIVLDHARPKLERSGFLPSLIQKCWDEDPMKRPSFTEIKFWLNSDISLYFPGVKLSTFKTYWDTLHKPK